MATAAQSQNDNNIAGAANNLDSVKNAPGNNQIVNKTTQFAKDRPWATATLAGVVGGALLKTLRGR